MQQADSKPYNSEIDDRMPATAVAMVYLGEDAQKHAFEPKNWCPSTILARGTHLSPIIRNVISGPSLSKFHA